MVSVYNMWCLCCFVIFMLTLSVVRTQTNCNELEKCKYNKYGKTVNCSSANLAHIPDITNCRTDVDSLYLSHNFIYELSTKAFKYTGWENLKKLYMKYCGLKTIHESSFSDLKNLDTIDLSHNEILELSPTIFRDNGRLQIIILNNNAFEILPDGLFQNMAAREIDVSNCKLSNIGSKAFINLNRLNILKLNDNKLTFLYLDVTLFNARDIRHIDIQNNPWHCNKKLNQSLQWIINKFSYDITCDSPSALKNKSLRDLKNEDFSSLVPKLKDKTVDCNTTDSLVQAVYETDYENNTCNDNSKIFIEPSVINYSTIYFPYKGVNYTCTFINSSHASVTKLCIKVLAERQSMKQPEDNQTVAGTTSDKWFLVGGLSSAAVLLCVFVLLLSYFVYRRHKRLKNESRTVSLATELEKEALVTIVNPVQKPPRNVRPSVTSTDTELTDIKRSARDDGSVFNNSTNDLSYTESVLLPGSQMDTGARTPDSVFYTPERKASYAGSVASTIPDILKQSGHQTPYSPVHKIMYQRRNETFPMRPHSPATSLRNYGNFTTLPRRIRNDSWSSAPPGSPTINRSHFQIYPISDNLGVRTNALGSALSLNKSESTDMLHRKPPQSIHTQLSQPATIQEEREKPTIPQKPAHLENKNKTYPGLNRIPQRRSWTGFSTNFKNEPLTVSNSSGPKTSVRSSLPPLPSVKNDGKLKIPPPPPPKPKNPNVFRESAYIEDEDGTEV